MAIKNIKTNTINPLLDAVIYQTQFHADKRVALLSTKHIFEARSANDLIGTAPFCRRKLFYDKKYAVPPPSVHDKLTIMYQHMAVDAFAKKHRHSRKVIKRISTHARYGAYKSMLCYPDRAIFLDKKKNTSWYPMYIDILDEPTFYATETGGVKNEYINTIQFALEVKNDVEYGVYCIFCPTMGFVKDWKIHRDKEIGEHLLAMTKEMDDCLMNNRYPAQTYGEHCQECPYYATCLRKNSPRSGDYQKDIESTVNRYFVAKKALKRAQMNYNILERDLIDSMGDDREAHTDEFDIIRQEIPKFKIDGERMAKEQPDILRLFKIPFTEKKLIVRR